MAIRPRPRHFRPHHRSESLSWSLAVLGAAVVAFPRM